MATKAKYETGDTPDEIWYPIPGWPGYEFSSDQRVRSFWKQGPRGGISPDRWKILKPLLIGGYPCYQFRRGGKTHGVNLHRIIALLAYGPTPDGLLVLHRDDDRSNYYPSNLSFGTHSENSYDAVQNKKVPLGSQKLLSKLEEDDIPQIRQLAETGMTHERIAERFGVSRSRITKIVLRKAWKHVA